MSPPYAATLEDIRNAHTRIQGMIHRTPVLTSSAINDLAGRQLWFKCENFQRVGAFKYRGGCNAVAHLTEEQAARGVCTHSSGNHAQAIARAARERGIPATIVMPSNAPEVKRAAVAGYGATIIPCAPTLEAREATAAEVVARTGAHFIHPYDDPHVIAGQGTAALELIAEVGPLDAILAPVGGGGLMAGSCIATRALLPHCRLFGAEPKGADDAARSMEAGHLIPQTGPNTICDGLLTSLGQLTWPILRDHLEAIITVSDAQTLEAMRLIWTRMKIIIEPSCATPLAVVLSERFRALEGIERVGIILTGGNVDLDRLPWVT
ncbi:MAG: pyridoxal-phosphate dependent enzyme [Myxococcota bacterium]